MLRVIEDFAKSLKNVGNSIIP